jgi:DNA-binding FrmR family transcriptional regulator
MSTMIANKRRCGNTTRQIDAFIQDLFQTGTVTVQDHAHQENGRGVPTNRANEQLVDTMLRRLRYEHKLNVYDDLEFDRKTMTITFKNNKEA